LERLEHKLSKEIDLALDKQKAKLQDQIFEYKTSDDTLTALYHDLLHVNEDSTVSMF
jgi:hypothetical protein